MVPTKWLGNIWYKVAQRVTIKEDNVAITDSIVVQATWK